MTTCRSLAVVCALLSLLVAREARAACNLDCAPGVCVGNGANSRCACSNVTCAAGQVCSTPANACCTETVTTCAGVMCGMVPKACGGFLDCSANSCVAPATCGGGGTANLCACTETVTSCTGRCGMVPKSCGGTLNCSANACPAGQVCNAQNTCAAPCAPTTCLAQGKNCGTISNGCGGTLSCGTCGGTDVCTANVCAPPVVRTTRFSAGSLIIPMDQCYNPDYGPTTAPNNNGITCVAGTPSTCYTTGSYTGGNVRLPFGLIYLLAQNHVPVSIILHPFKRGMIDDDFSVTPPGGSTNPTVAKLKRVGAAYQIDAAQLSCGTNTVHYGGMPFAVDSAFADQALKLIAQASSIGFGGGNTFDEVPLHVSNYGFDAPVLATVASRPKPVGISAAPLDTFFEESGIPAVTPPGSTYTFLQPSGAGYTYTWPQAALGPHPACPGGVCSKLTYTASDGSTQKILSVIWTERGSVGAWSEVGPWLADDGTALVVADATGWEANADNKLGGNMFVAQNGAQRGPYCATVAVDGANRWANPGPATTFPASNVYLQIGDMDLFTHGGGGGDGSAYGFVNPTAAANVHALVSNDDTYYSAVTGHPLVGGMQVPGDVVYLGSLNSWHGNAKGKDAGLHIMYNTLLVGGGGNGGGSGIPNPPPPVVKDIELTRSSPVGKVTGEIYLGTFDWQVPKDAALGGAFLVDPPKSVYPYVTGHFREYKSTIGAGSLKCDPAATGAICTWDTAGNIKPWAQRNVFIGTKSGSTYNIVTAASQAADATVAFIAGQIGTKLGGIDYGTAAVIESKGDGSLVTVANAKTRPTIAYFGARDGLLHAVCAQASGCYGTYTQGQELWAFLAPGVKAQIAAARVANDFSTVNVGGAMRVGDFQDTFGGGSSAYRTVLIAGTRESGHVFALDISNPDPANFNQDGFKLLWEQDGTDVNTGVTSIRMGATVGASLARKGNSAFAVVTSALSSTSAAGMNVHVLRLVDGKVLAVDQKLYTRNIPLPGGSSGKLPNDTPPLATLFDADTSGDDETVLVGDFEGVVRRLSLASGGTLVSGQGGAVFDTATGRCGAGQTCQPVGVSATLAKLGSGKVAAFIATGGADWARSATAQSYAFGFEVPAAGGTPAIQPSIFTRTLGTVQPPAGPPPANIVLDFPLRVYSQLTVSGTDLFALGTTISLGPINQLIQPVMFPGTYGQVLKWGGLDQTIDTNAQLYIPQGTDFSAGAGSVLQLNSSGGQGSIAIVGTTNSIRVAAPTSSLRNSALAIQITASGKRPFDVQTWFDLAN